MENQTCAIFIDGDNFMYNGVIELFEHIRSWKMKVIIKRVYGDFSEPAMLNWREICLDHNLTSIHSWSKHSKNSVDMKMTCDIQEYLYYDPYNIDVYILCTGDRDFIPLIEKIKSRQKRVIGVSTNYFGTSVNFKNECDEFYFVNRRNHEVDMYQMGKKGDNDTKEGTLKMVKKKRSNMVKKMVVKEEPKKVKKEKEKKSDCYSLSSDDFSMESFFESTHEKSKSQLSWDSKSPESSSAFRSRQNKDSMEMLKTKIYNEIQRLKEMKKTNTNSNSNSNPNTKTTEGSKKSKMDEILSGMEIEEIPMTTPQEDKKHPSRNAIKKLICSLLEKTSEGLFISQIKDEILKVYPHFQEKSYDPSYTFSKFIRSFEPDIKTRMKSEGVLYAFL